MSEYIHVGSATRLTKLTRGSSRVYPCNGEDVAVFRTREGYVAVSDTCPHMGASLSHGRLSGNQLECSWHEWKFNTDTGVSDARDWCCLNVYDVRIDGDKLFLRPRPKPEKPIRDRSAPDASDEEKWIEWDPDRYFKKPKDHDND
ncbi:MAG: Rieske 2Fe-2S domain-containing protein [Acidobacteria bacterium]|uniref:Rieske 2Fe-2S domain-containing protein n=1 Tax=Candidatus Polarisedimenticola svalbardensis TaxID=2886004 RepID=A0A8J6Y3L9_9BACT|nr:Rieske 2Fe-2S domain-containing protein [Candidatus Polarisedimenticola svalbardensis]